MPKRCGQIGVGRWKVRERPDCLLRRLDGLFVSTRKIISGRRLCQALRKVCSPRLEPKAIDTNVAYTAVRASRGKFTRAEPVAALYEQGRVHHVGGFPELEDQMTGFVADLDRAKFGSPDRVDALVWALTELLSQHVPFAGLLEFYRADTARMRAEQAGAILNG